MKIKVLIVDDEYLQRGMLKCAIDWDKLDMEIVGEAVDGKEALDISKKINPDIVIMDINIPYCNGIEVSKRIRQRNPDTQIIILTAYGQFDYARDALQLGAVSYILKPLDPAEMAFRLANCAKKLRSSWGQKEKMELLQLQKKQIQKEHFLLKLLTAPVCGEEDVENVLKKYGIDKQNKICVLDLYLYQNSGDYALIDAIEDIIEEFFSTCELLHMDNDFIEILFFKSKPDGFNILAQNLRNRINHEYSGQNRLCGGISHIHNGALDLYYAYQEARVARNQSIPCGRLLSYEPPHFLSFLKKGYYNPESLLNLLRAKKYEDALSMIHNCFEKSDSSQLSFAIATDMLLNFSLFLMELGIDISEKMSDEHKLISHLNELGKFQDVEQELCNFLKTGIELIEKRLPPSTKRKVEDACRFIDHNYTRSDLSLNLVAKEVGVNPSYLSNIFKNECGCSLTRYIMKIRLENARRKIDRDPSIPVSVLAEEVGYTDMYYFSKIFKKQFGISPSKYIGYKRKPIRPCPDSAGNTSIVR